MAVLRTATRGLYTIDESPCNEAGQLTPGPGFARILPHGSPPAGTALRADRSVDTHHCECYFAAHGRLFGRSIRSRQFLVWLPHTPRSRAHALHRDDCTWYLVRCFGTLEFTH
jgi:hypothetical protein